MVDAMPMLVVPRILVTMLILAGCTATGSSTSGPDAGARSPLLAGHLRGELRACVRAVPGRSLQAIDARTIVYRTSGALWVSRLPGDCPGLGASSTMIVEPSGSQYCRGDRVRGLEPNAVVPGPACPLGPFVAHRPPPAQ